RAAGAGLEGRRPHHRRRPHGQPAPDAARGIELPPRSRLVAHAGDLRADPAPGPHQRPRDAGHLQPRHRDGAGPRAAAGGLSRDRRGGGGVKLGVAVSGKGSNLRNLLDRGFPVVAVVTNRPSCGGAEIARAHGISLGEFPQSRFASALERDVALRDFLLAHGVELLVCAGYDRIFTAPLPAFARGLARLGYELYSTGGTLKALETASIDARPVSDLTGFPEIMDGRVKTLHPGVHGGLLARRDRPEHMAALDEHGLKPIDVLCVNLYPFVEALAAGGCFDEALAEIDIGGPA